MAPVRTRRKTHYSSQAPLDRDGTPVSRHRPVKKFHGAMTMRRYRTPRTGFTPATKNTKTGHTAGTMRPVERLVSQERITLHPDKRDLSFMG
jgi:hypothetical protein